MKIIQVGLGEHGFSWMQDILLQDDNVQIVAIVDKNQILLNKAKDLCGLDNSLLFDDLSEALAKTNPDFILNVTPPSFHKEIDFIAFKHRIPVLSEKRIAESYADATEIAQKPTS